MADDGRAALGSDPSRGIVLRGLGEHGRYAIPVWRDLLEMCGMVRGTRDNVRALMRHGHHVLVFPGGAGEVFKRRGQKYQLLWKERLGMAEPMSNHRIDVHAHALTPWYRSALEAARIDRIGGIPVPAWSPELATEFMDAHGIERQYLSLSDPGVDFLDQKAAAALAREVNDELAAIAVADERFGAFAAVSLRDVDAACAEISRALDALHLDGVGLLSSTADGRYLGDPLFDSLVAELDRRGAWVFVHPTAVPADARPDYAIPDFIAEYPFDTTRTFISLLFNGVFDRHPRIRWHFAHGGGTLPMLRKRIETLAGFAPLAVDALGIPRGARDLDAGSAARALARSFFDTALVADRPALLAVQAMSGTERIVFGSDWPFAALMYGEGGDPQPALGEVFGPAERRRIDHDNAYEALLTNASKA